MEIEWRARSINKQRIGAHGVRSQRASGRICNHCGGAKNNIMVDSTRTDGGVISGYGVAGWIIENIVSYGEVRLRVPQHDLSFLSASILEGERIVSYQDVIQSVRSLDGPAMGDVVK